MEQICITELNRMEVLRYLGHSGELVPDSLEELLRQGEGIIAKMAKPRYVYRMFDIEHSEEGVLFKGTSMCLRGKDIVEHLKDCKQVVLVCATISEEVDNAIRNAENKDIALALILDCMGSVAVEQVANKVDEIIHNRLPDKFMTFRYGVGYGDLPIAQQREVIGVLEATKRIGVTVTESDIMLPRKSVTGIIGVGDKPMDKKRLGCEMCNMKEKCKFRKEGRRCNG